MDVKLVIIVLLLVVSVAGYIRLYRHYRRNIKKVIFLFDAIDNVDFSFNFPMQGVSKNDRILHQSLNRIKAFLQHTREEQMEREKYYEKILNMVDAGIMVVDSHDNVLQHNQAALRLLDTDVLTHLNQVKTKLKDEHLSKHETATMIKDKPVRIIAISDVSHELSNQVWAMGFGTNCAISDHDNTYDWFGAIDGEVVFWPATSNFRNYLETMQTWYAEGLIDAEFMSRTGGNTADRELIADGSSGLWWSTLGDFGGFTANDANAVFEAAPTPSKDGNYTGAMIPAAMIRDRTCLNISTNCEQPELAAAYLDYMYSEDGQLLSNYGVESKTFEYDADGNPQFTEFVTNSETGFDASLTMILYGLGNFPSAFNPQRYYNDTQTAALDTWGAYAGMDTGIQGMSAALNLSGEDATTAAGLLSDIMTYVRETTFKVICNQATMDDYDQMVKDLEGMDLGTVLELYQASYDANFK